MSAGPSAPGRPHAASPASPAAASLGAGGRPPAWRTAALAAALHGVLAAVCVALSRGPVEVATLWLANAPVVALLWLRPGHAGVALPAVAGVNALVNVLAGQAALPVAIFMAGNVAAITVALWLLRRFGPAPALLRSALGLARVLFFGALLPEVAGATVATAMAAATASMAVGPLWSTWVQSGWIGGFVVLPLALLLIGADAAQLRRSLGRWQMLVLLPLCVGAALLALVHLPFPFVMLAMPLVAAVMWVDQTSHATLVAAVALTAAVATVAGAFLPPPVQSHWEGMYVTLALLSALLPTQLLAAARAQQIDHLAELAAQADALRRANDGLEQFVRIASHDLREPLNTVVQFAQLARDDAGSALPPGPRRYLELVGKAGIRMRSLLDDILQYARLQREHLGEPVVVELTPLLEAVQANLAASMRASAAEVLIGPLPAVKGHAWLLQLLFQNLVGNALKFVPPGVSPRVQVSAERVGVRVRVTVADNGIGIAAEDQPRLFKPFSRLHLRRQYEGTGLGLTLVAEVARLHGGEVHLASEPGRGSRFTVELPIAE